MSSVGVQKPRITLNWVNKFRRLKRNPPIKKDDNFTICEISWDDLEEREPWWEEEHKILGEDHFAGRDCWVIESRNKVDSNYYLGKRVSWIDKKDFLDLHEEQFDRQGHMFRIIDKEWTQVPPWNYWAPSQWNAISLTSGQRSLYQWYDWIFDQGFSDKVFSNQALEREYIWRKANNSPPYIKGEADFPAPPQVREAFWSK